MHHNNYVSNRENECKMQEIGLYKDCGTLFYISTRKLAIAIF